MADSQASANSSANSQASSSGGGSVSAFSSSQASAQAAAVQEATPTASMEHIAVNDLLTFDNVNHIRPHDFHNFQQHDYNSMVNAEVRVAQDLTDQMARVFEQDVHDHNLQGTGGGLAQGHLTTETQNYQQTISDFIKADVIALQEINGHHHGSDSHNGMGAVYHDLLHAEHADIQFSHQIGDFSTANDLTHDFATINHAIVSDFLLG